MDKRIVILLVICSFLAVTTVTVKYIEREKEKIKARFFNLPKMEKTDTRRGPLWVPSPPQEPVQEEKMVAPADEGKGAPLPDAQIIPGEERDLLKDKMPGAKKAVPQEVRSDEKGAKPAGAEKIGGAKGEKVPVAVGKRDDTEQKEAVTPPEEEKENGEGRIMQEGEEKGGRSEKGVLPEGNRGRAEEKERKLSREDGEEKEVGKDEGEVEEEATAPEESVGDREDQEEPGEEEGAVGAGEEEREGEEQKETRDKKQEKEESDEEIIYEKGTYRERTTAPAKEEGIVEIE